MANIIDSPNVNLSMNKSENVIVSSSEQCQLSSIENNVNVNDETEQLKTNEECSNSTNLYKDFSGIDTESFIITTLRNNPKDRSLLLTLEKVFHDFIENNEQTSYQFQAMNSYERMIVHRVAACFGLDHNVDKNGQSIIVNKTTNTRIPNFSFENFIPQDELINDDLNNSIENTTRRIGTRNEKTSNQQISTKSSSSERVHNQHENQSYNKIDRRQQRVNAHHHHLQQANIQPSSHMINTRTQPIYPSTYNSYYLQQQSTDHDYKQQTTNSPMYNYVSMMSPTSFQHGNSIPLPILLHQQPTGQIQYVFPSNSFQQSTGLSSDGQYMPVYRSGIIPPVVENNPYFHPSFVRLYPTNPYPNSPQTTFIQTASPFMISPNNSTSLQYATNQLASLNLQTQSTNSIKPFHQSFSNGLTRMSRQNRPLNSTNADKNVTTIENDVKSTIKNNSEKILSESIQEKD